MSASSPQIDAGAGADVVATAAEAARAPRPPLIVLEPLERLLDRHGIGAGPIIARPIGDGHSNVTYELRRDGARVVLRRPPRPPIAPSTHDVLREARLLTALGPAGVRVPAVLMTCDDPTVIGMPFFVMEHIDGDVPGERLAAAHDTVAARRQLAHELVDALVELHAVDVTRGDLAGFGRPAGYLERQLRRFGSLWKTHRTRDVPDVVATGRWLTAHLPAQRAATIVHGDYRLGNTMFEHARPRLRVILDWEMAALGDPLADLGYLCATWSQPGVQDNPISVLSAVTQRDGFPTPDGLRERYAARSGRDVDDLRFYEALALWKLAVLMEGNYRRHLAGGGDDAYLAGLEDGVPQLARQALALTTSAERAPARLRTPSIGRTAVTRTSTPTPTHEDGTWELPHELQLLRETVADFVRNEILPEEAKLDTDAYKLPPAALARVQGIARDAGLWCVQSPEEHGGAGLSLLAQCVVAEEAAKCRMGAYVPAGAAFGWDPPNVIFKGTAEQIERYARPEVIGEKTYVAISEPNGGSDPARAIQATARRDGDHYVLNGQKTWITGGDAARWGVVFARTAGPGRDGISCFVVETGSEGVSVEPIPVIRSLSPVEMFFEGVRVPVANRLGEEGKGFELAEDWLVHGRVPYAAGTIGVAEAALRLAVDYAKERTTFGRLLAQRQAIQWMLADSEIELRAARLLTYQAAWKADLGKDYKVDASVAKVYATEMAGRVVDRAMQVLGGMGVAKELPLERWYREMRIKRIGEGPSEVHRLVVARAILGDAAREG